MRFVHYEVEAGVGNVVEVRLNSDESEVLVVDESNFHKYRCGSNSSFLGGHFSQSPVSICLPAAKKWHILVSIADTCGAGGADDPAVKLI
jgi:hypothetical protein